MTAQVWLLVLAAAAGHAVWNLAARRASGSLTAIWTALAAGCALLFPAVVFLLCNRGLGALIGTAGYGYIAATGLVHLAYFLLLSRAYGRGEISVVYPVARGSGIGLTALLGWSLLEETVTRCGAAGIGLVLCGVLLMGAPALRARRAVHGFGTALWVGLSIVAYSLVDKLGVGHVHPVVYLWAMFLIVVLVLAPTVLCRPGLAEALRPHWYQVATMAVGMPTTYLMILFAFTRGPVSYIVAARELAVVFGALLGLVVLGERFSLLKGAAVLTIAAGMVLIKLG